LIHLGHTAKSNEEEKKRREEKLERNEFGLHEVLLDFF
jgi:hypothetical protein